MWNLHSIKYNGMKRKRKRNDTQAIQIHKKIITIQNTEQQQQNTDKLKKKNNNI